MILISVEMLRVKCSVTALLLQCYCSGPQKLDVRVPLSVPKPSLVMILFLTSLSFVAFRCKRSETSGLLRKLTVGFLWKTRAFFKLKSDTGGVDQVFGLMRGTSSHI